MSHDDKSEAKQCEAILALARAVQAIAAETGKSGHKALYEHIDELLGHPFAGEPSPPEEAAPPPEAERQVDWAGQAADADAAGEPPAPAKDPLGADVHAAVDEGAKRGDDTKAGDA